MNSIRCLNFHLITALIKANRSERKAPVSLFRVNCSYQMIKGHSWASEIPHLRLHSGCINRGNRDPALLDFSRFLARRAYRAGDSPAICQLASSCKQ